MLGKAYTTNAKKICRTSKCDYLISSFFSIETMYSKFIFPHQITPLYLSPRSCERETGSGKREEFWRII